VTALWVTALPAAMVLRVAVALRTVTGLRVAATLAAMPRQPAAHRTATARRIAAATTKPWAATALAPRTAMAFPHLPAPAGAVAAQNQRPATTGETAAPGTGATPPLQRLGFGGRQTSAADAARRRTTAVTCPEASTLGPL
jgi:hypothetical protein